MPIVAQAVGLYVAPRLAEDGSMATKMLTMGRAALVLTVVVVGLFVAAGGWQALYWGDSLEEVPCECPNTQSIVGAIDWMGDGSASDSVSSWGGGLDGSEKPRVSLEFSGFTDLDSARAALDGLVERLAAAGLSPEFLASDSPVVYTDASRVSIYAPLRESESPWIGITVSVFVDDPEAAEALAPFVDALGILD